MAILLDSLPVQCHTAVVQVNTDVVVVGAGIVGAACAYYATQRGLSVTVVERAAIASGTTSAGEGNILVSDKPAGPELDLALLSHQLWLELGNLAGSAFELEAKGGLIITAEESSEQSPALAAFVAGQRAAGVSVTAVPAAELREYEPHIAPDLAGGYFYPQDLQVQPMLATAHLLRRARAAGARVQPNQPVTGFLRAGDRVVGVRTAAGDIGCGSVVNAAGTWAGSLASLAGVVVPVAPRRGFILVTEPLPPTVLHKVYLAGYVADVASDSAALQTSTVVEATRSGTVLIGSSRERVGFDDSLSLTALRLMAAGAVRLFPFLESVAALRSYHGFRPYCPDHLPVIGADPRAPGLLHACGHEGAGIGLSLATGQLIAQVLTGSAPSLPLAHFAPERFAA
jgi:glycine/D-amino acid oxidase-like deaminating enzyme